MNTYGDLNDVQNLMTQIIARDVATGVEFARSIGHKMPKDFTIGVRFAAELDGRTRVRIRFEDARHEILVTLPRMDAPVVRVNALFEEAWDRLHAEASAVVHIWLGAHPESFAPDARKALAIVEGLKADDELLKKWSALCAERVGQFTYKTER